MGIDKLPLLFRFAWRQFEDYSGNEISKLDTIISSFSPLSLTTLVKQGKKPVLSFIEEMTGVRLESESSILEEQPELKDTARDLVLNLWGVQSFTESSRLKYKRKLKAITQDKYPDRTYDSLSAKEKFNVAKTAEDLGIERGSGYVNLDRLQKYYKKRFEQEARDPAFAKELIALKVFEDITSMTKKSVTINNVRVELGDEEHKEAFKSFVKNLKEARKTFTGTPTKKQMKDTATKIWDNEIRSRGYPTPKRRF